MEDGKLVIEEQEPPEQSGRQEALSRLMPTIDKAVGNAGWRKEDIKLLVVGIGPGSFTGIRTCVVTARTLAQALRLPLIGLDSMYCRAKDLVLPASIIIAGGRGHYFIASYAPAQQPDGLPQILEAPSCIKAADVETQLNVSRRVYVEPGLDEVHSLLASSQGRWQYEELPPMENLSSKQAVIAWSLVCEHLSVKEDVDGLAKVYDFQRVLPLYLRSPSITLKK